MAANRNNPGRQWKWPKLRTFSGGEESVDEFISEVTLYMDLHTMPARQAATWVLEALEGEAKSLILGRQSHELDTPTKVLNLLKDEWGNNRSHVKRTSAFFSRKQKSAETISRYAANLRWLWNSCNEILPVGAKLTEEHIKDRFVEGVKNISLRRELQRVIRYNLQNQQISLQHLVTFAKDWLRDETEDDDSPTRAADVVAEPDVSVDYVRGRPQEPKSQNFLVKPGSNDQRREVEECRREIELLRTSLADSKKEIERMKDNMVVDHGQGRSDLLDHPRSKRDLIERDTFPRGSQQVGRSFHAGTVPMGPEPPFRFGARRAEPPTCWNCGGDDHLRAQCNRGRLRQNKPHPGWGNQRPRQGYGTRREQSTYDEGPPEWYPREENEYDRYANAYAPPHGIPRMRTGYRTGTYQGN